MDHRAFIRKLQVPLHGARGSRAFSRTADADQEQPDSILDLVADLDKIFEEFSGTLKHGQT